MLDILGRRGRFFWLFLVYSLFVGHLSTPIFGVKCYLGSFRGRFDGGPQTGRGSFFGSRGASATLKGSPAYLLFEREVLSEVLLVVFEEFVDFVFCI